VKKFLLLRGYEKKVMKENWLEKNYGRKVKLNIASDTTLLERLVGQKDKWVWGQFCPLIPAEDLKKVIKKGKKRKTII